MEAKTINQKTAHTLTLLEERLDELIHLCRQLAEENRTLHDQQAVLTAERDELIEKNELSRARIEAMIARLRALEQ